jgi:serine phosphatase RsbU (regulator of sigma subunit)
MDHEPAEHMTCMEVWGGNQAADNGVVMSGLDAWVYCRPFEQSVGGGDVYYVSSCATGRITRLLLADVSGHGQVVSDIAGALRKLMQRYVNFIDQTAFVGSMNSQFKQLSEGGCFATAIVSTFFGPTNELTLCIAGHPPPLLYRAAKREWSLLSQSENGASGNLPLGIDDVTDWEQLSVRLRVGDLVLCYTDSLIESRDATGEMIGIDGLLKAASTIDVSDPQRIISNLIAAIESSGTLGKDDVTALLFRPNGMAPYLPLKDRVLAPFRVLGKVVASLRPGADPAPWPEFSVPNLGGALIKSLNWFGGRKPAER